MGFGSTQSFFHGVEGYIRIGIIRPVSAGIALIGAIGLVVLATHGFSTLTGFTGGIQRIVVDVGYMQDIKRASAISLE